MEEVHDEPPGLFLSPPLSLSLSLTAHSQFPLPLACPKTPVDPCDRVKFILGEIGEDSTDQPETAHHIFAELEELHYDEHAHWWVGQLNISAFDTCINYAY